MAIFKGRVRVRYGYSRWGYTRNNGKGWHGGSDEEGLDSTTILMRSFGAVDIKDLLHRFRTFCPILPGRFSIGQWAWRVKS